MTNLLVPADRAKLAALKPAAAAVPTELPDLSDDECLTRLARAVAARDPSIWTKSRG